MSFTTHTTHTSWMPHCHFPLTPPSQPTPLPDKWELHVCVGKAFLLSLLSGHPPQPPIPDPRSPITCSGEHHSSRCRQAGMVVVGRQRAKGRQWYGVPLNQNHNHHPNHPGRWGGRGEKAGRQVKRCRCVVPCHSVVSEVRGRWQVCSAGVAVQW